MARSSYIYLIFDTTQKVVAAFTVKYEAFNWLATTNLLHANRFVVKRFKDSPYVEDGADRGEVVTE